jgi:hypothetical protein
MQRREFLAAAGLTSAMLAAAQRNDQPATDSRIPSEKVDFGYAFAPPHHITVARPEASEKTLLDLEPGLLTISWSYEDLRTTPLATFKTPPTDWRIRIEPYIDGKAIGQSAWKRGDAFLPMLDNEYLGTDGTRVRLEAIGAEGAALVKISLHNSGTTQRRFGLRCEVLKGWVAHNAAWMDTGRDPDTLLAGQSDRPDRVLLFGLGGERYPVAAKAMTLEWSLAPGESREGWLVRPYQAYQAELAGLRRVDWPARFEAAVAEWRGLLARAAVFEIPDFGVRNGFYASLGDVFIMREPLKDGYLGVVPGTEMYRAPNPVEPCIAAIALDQLGYHSEAADGLRVHLEMQEANGDCADPKGWAHHMWGASGFKAWAAMEHYRLTGDRAYLESVYPRMAASARWQELRRRETRGASEIAAQGLMPRGMGDGGLLNGSDYFGVFYPHNVMATYADRLAAEAASELGKTPDAAELRGIYERALASLMASLKEGSIAEDGYRWIPGSPGQRSGSRWGALYGLFPAGLMAADDPLITGSLRKIESSISAGGQPVHTGWMEDGAWVGITIDNVAEAHLARGNGDAAADYLYSSLNHGTPLYTWCEERGLEAGTKKTSGDRQHLWTPVAVLRLVRDALVMEQGDRLHLGLGTARSWLEQGKSVGVREAPTHFGVVSYRIESDVARGRIRGLVDTPQRRAPAEVMLHLRHPARARMMSVTVNGKDTREFSAEGEWVRVLREGRAEVVAEY